MIPPFFSIIVPSFNASETIRGLLNSILEQSFKHFEIVIIDGVSSDHTIEIIHSYNDPRIRVFSEKDNGIYDAMNKGIACAEGTWLYFMGADDIIYDSTILAQIKENIDNKSIKDIIYGDVQIIGNGIWAKHSDIYDGPFDMEKLFKKNICHQSIFYNKSVFTTIGVYNLEYKIIADYEFNLRCFSKFYPQWIDLIVAKFNATEGLSNTESETFNSRAFFDDAFLLFKDRLTHPEFDPLTSRVTKFAIRNRKKLGNKLFLKILIKYIYIKIFRRFCRQSRLQ